MAPHYERKPLLVGVHHAPFRKVLVMLYAPLVLSWTLLLAVVAAGFTCGMTLWDELLCQTPVTIRKIRTAWAGL